MSARDDILDALEEKGVRDLLPVAPPKISPGDVFHFWTVLSEAGRRNQQRAYLCRCRCGAESVLPASKLRTGHSKSCGCLKADLARKRFGKPVRVGEVFFRLTAVAESYRRKTGKSSTLYVRCQCVCGAVKDCCVSHLRAGKTRSCGCIRSETAAARAIEINNGDVFGCYTVLRLDETDRPGQKRRRRFLCQCECGNIRSVLGFSLASGAIKSCGCLKGRAAGTHGMTPEQRADRDRRRRREYRRENVARVRELQRGYRLRNKTEINAKKAASERSRKQTDPGYRMLSALRKRLSKTVRGARAEASAIRDLGCSVEDFRGYLEKHFEPGWTWENYGVEWTVDHVFPLSFVDFSDSVEAKAACNWRNLRPMSASDNASKNNALSAKAQYLFECIKDIVRRSLQASDGA